MTTITKEQCAKWARECGLWPDFDDVQTRPIDGADLKEELHAFALKVLAEKELEVLKLREALQPFAKGDWTTELALKAQLELSTPPSTEALDEYVAARIAESGDRRGAERYQYLLDRCVKVESDGYFNLIYEPNRAIKDHPPATPETLRYWIDNDIAHDSNTYSVDEFDAKYAAIEAEKVRMK